MSVTVWTVARIKLAEIALRRCDCHRPPADPQENLLTSTKSMCSEIILILHHASGGFSKPDQRVDATLHVQSISPAFEHA